MKNQLIENTVHFVQERLRGAEAGHDWFHTERVWKMAIKIQEREGGDLAVIEIAALLHDIADPKFHNGNDVLALFISENFLKIQNVEDHTAAHVLSIIKNISFKDRQRGSLHFTLEHKIVQDADRLDAIGAIGIARTFNFGGFKNNILYDPSISPKTGMTTEEYKRSEGTTVNHFYEKLLLLKDLMNTAAAKEIAQSRHEFMLKFLDQFYTEWNQACE